MGNHSLKFKSIYIYFFILIFYFSYCYELPIYIISCCTSVLLYVLLLNEVYACCKRFPSHTQTCTCNTTKTSGLSN